MIQVLRWWNAANVQHYRLDGQRKHHESTFSVFLNVGSIIAARSPLLECHSKNIWFRVDQPPGSSSRNHMQHAAERLSQQLCLLLSPTNTMRNTNTLSPTVAANTVFIHFLLDLHCWLSSRWRFTIGKKRMIVFHGGQLESVAIASNYVG